MNRNEAKIWASIPREKLAVIASHIDKHFDLLCAYANGAEIEFREPKDDKWFPNVSPSFRNDFDYRVKPNDSAQPAEPWKPKDGEKFFCVCGDGEVCYVDFDEDFENDKEYIDFGNCFRTREEAEAARERVRAALKGETFSKTETVENKSHVVELSEFRNQERGGRSLVARETIP